MKHFVKYKPYAFLALCGFALWVLETAYFGFNDNPESGLEAMLDTISFVMIIWGVIGDIAGELYVIKINNPARDFKIKTELKLPKNCNLINPSKHE